MSRIFLFYLFFDMFPVFFNARNKEFCEILCRDHIAFCVVANYAGKLTVAIAVIPIGILALNLQFSAERSLFRGNDTFIFIIFSKSSPYCIFINFAIAAFPYSVFRRFFAPPGKESFKVIAKNIYRVFLFLLAISFGAKALMDILNTFLKRKNVFSCRGNHDHCAQILLRSFAIPKDGYFADGLEETFGLWLSDGGSPTYPFAGSFEVLQTANKHTGQDLCSCPVY